MIYGDQSPPSLAGGISPPPLIQPQPPVDPMQQSGAGQFNDAASGIQSIAQNFAAGFSKDPARRAQAQQQLQVEQVQRQQELQQLREHQMHYMDTMIQLASNGGDTPSVREHVRQTAGPNGSIAKLMGPDAAAQYFQLYDAAATAFQNSPKNLQKLGPGEQLVDTSGKSVASVPANAQDPIGRAAQDLKAGLITQDEFNAIKAKEIYIQPPPQTTVNVQSEVQHNKNVDDMKAGFVKDLHDQETKAAGALIQIRRLHEARASGFKPGAGADVAASIGNTLQYFGIDPGLAERWLHPASQVEAQQASSALVQAVVGKLGTGFSDADRNFTTGQLQKTTDPMQAFDLTVDYLEKRSQREIKVARKARDAYLSNGDPYQPWNEYVDQIGSEAASPVPASGPDGTVLPAGVPAGSTQVGVSKKTGNPVYKLPDGSTVEYAP